MNAKVRQVVRIPLEEGVSTDFITFDGLSDSKEHFVLGFGDWREAKCPHVRIHSECLTGDVFGFQKCDCCPQLKEAVTLLSEKGGLLLHLRQEGRGIGLYNKIDSYDLQDKGFDTFEAHRELTFLDDLRDFGCAAEMLRVLNCIQVQLLSSNQEKIEQLCRYGINLTERMSTGLFFNKDNLRYLMTKEMKAGHHLVSIRGMFK